MGRSNALTKKISKIIEGIKELLPKLNTRTGKLSTSKGKQHTQLNPLPDFIFPLDNPTIVRSNDPIDISKLDPYEFELIGSKLVFLGPDIFWNGLVQIKCPLCKKVAASHGWAPGFRRVKALHHTYFLVGRRYKCEKCAGECQNRSPAHLRCQDISSCGRA
jgi:hypothetical protein